MRKIIHIDMDAFYASVEQRDHPELRGRPVAVGGSRERGVVAAASYEARAFGVRSAMPSVTARRLCPDLIFVKPRFDVYKAVSDTIRGIFEDFTDQIEPLSLDEAYLDVTDDRAGAGSATAIAEAIRARIKAEVGLTASAGVSYNKLIAKLASDQNKPNGICVIPPGRGPEFVATLPVGRLHGVGPVTAKKMNASGIMTVADLRDLDLDTLQHRFGKSGSYFYWAARGRDERAVRPDRIRKSIGAERTFFTDIELPKDLDAALVPIAAAVWERAERSGAQARTVTLKAKYNDFRIVTRARSGFGVIASEGALLAAGRDLLAPLLPVSKPIRLLGLSLSSLGGQEAEPDAQLALAI